MSNSEKDRGIVLHTMRYGENGIIVYMYTENNGRTSYFMRSNKHGRVTIGKNSIALQPLTPLNFVSLSSRDGSSVRISEAKRSFINASTLFDIRKSTIALFLSEFIYKVVKENFSNPLLFDFVYNSINVLDAMEDGVSNFHLYFVVRLSQYIGFSPTVNYEENSFFDITLGKYTIIRPSHDLYFTQDSAYFLNIIQNSGITTLHLIKMNRIQRIDFLQSMIQYYEYHNETSYRIESVKILSEIF